MGGPIQLGQHWAFIDTDPAPGPSAGWIGRWAIYANRDQATEAEWPDKQSAIVSGTTAVCTTESCARRLAEADATRTETVLSGAYRRSDA